LIPDLEGFSAILEISCVAVLLRKTTATKEKAVDPWVRLDAAISALFAQIAALELAAPKSPPGDEPGGKFWEENVQGGRLDGAMKIPGENGRPEGRNGAADR
jgi:hypothetical protein